MPPRLIPGLVVSPNGFGFRTNTGEVYRLNAAARQILAWLEEGDDEGRIAQKLAGEHQLELPRVRRDVSAFLESLRHLQLLRRDE